MNVNDTTPRHPRAHRLARALLSFGLAFGVAATGCDTGSTPADTRPDARRYEGQDIFDGLFFGVGPIGDLLLDVAGQMPADERERMNAALTEQGLDPAALDEMTAQADGEHVRAEIRGLIAERDATFFDRFGAAMQSGDPFEVDAALDEALDHLAWARASLDDRDVDSLSATPEPQSCGVGIACVAVVAAAVVNAAVVVNGLWIWNGAWFWSGAPDGEVNELGRDRIVDLLTTRLAVR